MANRQKQIFRYHTILPIIVIGFFVFVGGAIILLIHAATPAISLEAEAGVPTGTASVINDSSASNGKSVRFGSVVPAPSPSPSPSRVPGTPPSNGGKTKPVFIIYYMWWDRNHWTSHLGGSYPLSQTPNPLPATLDSSGCGSVNNYNGNVLTDVSQGLAYDQNNYQTFLSDVQTAAATGASGFAVNWVGDGSTSQSASSVTYDRRLQYMVDAVHAVNASGIPFKLMINYQSSAKILPLAQFRNDFQYLKNTYGNDSAFDHTYSSKLEIIVAGTWKYSDADVQTISGFTRPDFYFIGDEKPASWNASRANSVDGTSFYWSSQDPNKNPSSFGQIQSFAATVRATRNPDGSAKTWFAPFTPGYNAMLLYHTSTCVARDNGLTMHKLFDGNVPSNPDGWTLISWNEISEGSYIVPLTRYGNTYTNELRTVISTGR